MTSATQEPAPGARGIAFGGTLGWLLCMLAIAAAGLALLLAGAGDGGPAAHARGEPGQYRVLRTASLLDAGADGAGQVVALPHRLGGARAAAGLSWYRVDFTLAAAAPGAPAAVCVPRWPAGSAAMLDGQALIAPGPAGLIARARPQLLALPPGLAGGSHTLDIGLRALPGVDAGLSAPWIGDGALIRSACQNLAEAQHQRMFGSALLMAVMALAGLLMALLLRDRGALCFALMAALWLLHFWLVNGTWLSISEATWSLLYFATRIAFSLPLFLFCLRCANVERPRLERALMALYAAGFGALALLPAAQRPLWLSTMAALLVLAALYFLAILIRAARRELRVSGCILSAAFTFGIVAHGLRRLHLLGLDAYGAAPISDVAVPFLFCAFGALLIEKFLRDRQREARAAQFLREELARQRTQIAADFLVLREQGERLAVLEERRRIVRDMHDGLGSHLVSASAMLRSGAAAAADAPVLQVVEAALQELRGVLDVLALTPSDDPGDDPVSMLLGSLRWRLAPVLQARAIALDWQADCLPAGFLRDDSARLQLLRLLQEAFANILKHADARRVRFCSRAAPDAITIEVRDDGRGFDAQAAQVQPGLGLRTMRERCARLGGALSITSGPGGTALVLRFDVADVGAADVGAAGVGVADVGAAGIGAAGVGAADAGAAAAAENRSAAALV